MKRAAGGEGGLPRKLTAVGTLGDVGAAYTVYEKNWVCPECQSENYPRRARCHRCRAPKVAAPDALVTDSAGDRHAWREALDPSTNQIYYYNAETQQTQWERPAEMGAAPHGESRRHESMGGLGSRTVLTV
jgi:rubredoxin